MLVGARSIVALKARICKSVAHTVAQAFTVAQSLYCTSYFAMVNALIEATVCVSSIPVSSIMKPVVLAGTLIISKLQEAILVVQTFEMSVESQNLPQLMHDWPMPIAKQRKHR